ncbi:MAG: aminotransferase class I/II-fold pyridoxal phosphate-dependent enzyme [Acidimicrobiia bacterium]
MVDWLDAEDSRRTGGIKWAAVPDGTLAAWVAEMDVAPPAGVSVALADAVDRHAVLYPPLESMTDLPTVIAGWHGRRLGQSVDADRVLYTGDVIAGLVFTLRTLLPVGSGVVLTTPVYHPFFSSLDEAGMHQVRIPLLAEGRRFRLDVERIGEAFAAGARAIVLCNPHNPTGSAPTVDELAAVGDLAERHDALVVTDEVHLPLTLPGRTATPFTVARPDLAGRTVTLTSGSKAYNLPGLRFAWLVAGDDALAHRLRTPAFFARGAWSGPGQVAARAALDGADGWLDDLVADLADRHALVAAALADRLPDDAIAVPDASFLAWLDLRATSISADPVAALDAAGVRVSPGAQFGSEGRGHVRLNVAAAESTLDRVLERIVGAI